MKQSKLLDTQPSEIPESSQATISHPTSLKPSKFLMLRSLKSFQALVQLSQLLWQALPWLLLLLHSPSDLLSDESIRLMSNSKQKH